MAFVDKKLRKDVKNKLDSILFKKGFADLVDGPVLGFSIDYLDDNYGQLVPVEYQDEIIAMLEAFVENDIEKLNAAVGSGLTELVNLPFADSDETAQWVAINITMLYKWIKWYLEKNKKTS